MREIGSVPRFDDASRLADYLLTLGIRTRVEQKGDAATVWVFDEDQRERARAELEDFNRNPADARYAQAGSQARSLQREAEQRERRYRKNVVQLRDRWDARHVGRRPVTLVLLFTSIAVAIATSFGSGEANPKLVSDMFIVAPPSQDAPKTLPTLTTTIFSQPWRLVTPIFLHFGIAHLVFNMFALLDLGTQVEGKRGWWRMLLIVLVLAVVSNVTQFYWSGPYFGGMSGVGFGLFGYVWTKCAYDPESHFIMHPTTVLAFMGWFALCMLGIIPGVANAAHCAGLIAGMLIAYAPIEWRRLRRS